MYAVNLLPVMYCCILVEPLKHQDSKVFDTSFGRQLSGSTPSSRQDSFSSRHDSFTSPTQREIPVRLEPMFSSPPGECMTV